MRMVSLPPVCDTNLSQTQRMSFENNNNNNSLREASFSSYLNHAEKEFVRKLAESTRGRSNPTISTTPEEEGDIEVFGAEKYFNGGMDIPNPPKLRPTKQQCKKPEQTQLHHPKKPQGSRSGTPSVRSESSWNSQNALLQNVHRNSSRAPKPNKSSQSKGGFLYKCSCCDKNSVQVDTIANTISINNTHRYTVTNTKINAKQPTRPSLNFTFQNSIPPKVAEPKTLPLKMQIQVEDPPPRKSIEVFGSSLLGKPNDSVNLEKRLSMLSWNDINPRVKDSNVSATYSKAINNEDAESDASSDLFELESLTGNPNSFLTGQDTDCTDCVTPTTCYAPSEASIEWSVITSSAADFSIMSDYDERRLSTTSPERNISTTAYMIKSNYASDVIDIQRRRSNLLVGFKSQKAVRVAGDSYTKTNGEMIDYEARRAQRSDSFGRLTRFEAETKIMGFSSSERQHGLATNSLPRRCGIQKCRMVSTAAAEATTTTTIDDHESGY